MSSIEASSPAHYIIPNESGYFPAGSDSVATLASIDNVALHQIRPRQDDISDKPLAAGTLTLRDPDDGTADDVALVGRCGETLFYVMNDDAVTKRKESEFLLMLPEDCLLLDMANCSDEDILQVEGLLAARTKFHDETSAVAYPPGLPEDSVSRSMFRASSQLSRMAIKAGEVGASKIDAYGEKKRGEIAEGKDVKIGKTSLTLAKGTRKVAETTLTVAETISSKVSDTLSGKVGKAAVPKESDSAGKKKARSLLLASAMSYAEIGNGASEAYETLVKSAQSQATSFVAKKYGREAAELARHTTGAAVNFGRAALTTKRVVNVKKVVKSAVKQRVKQEIKNAVR